MLVSIKYKDNIIFDIDDPDFMPELGERVGFAEYDSVYKVVDIFNVFSIENKTMCVIITVEKVSY